MSWQTVRSEDLDLKPRTDAEMQLSTFLSPYDVPRAYRASRDEDGRLVVEFQYMGPEMWNRRRRESDGVALRIGANSGRLYGIELDSADIDVDEMIAAIESQARGDKRATDNLELAKQILARQGDVLLEQPTR